MKFWASVKNRINNRLRRRNRGTIDSDEDNFDYPTVTLTERFDPADPAPAPMNATTPLRQLTFLYALTKRWAWEAVAFRCQTHPHEATTREQDVNGDTILHWACFGSPPLYVIEAILHACPELATIRNTKGLLPLHTACCYRASPEVIRALVQKFPDSAAMTIATKEERGGSTPLHLLCDYGCQADSLRAILETEAGAASTRKKDRIYRRTALQILNERKNLSEYHSHLAELRRIQGRNPGQPRLFDYEQRPENSFEIVLLLERIKTMGFWEKAQLLALGEYTQQPVSTMEPSNTTVIHALIGLKYCPSSILEMANFMMPHELLRKDEHGDLPLHFACRHANEDVICDVLRAQPKAASLPNADDLLPLQVYLQRDRKRSWNHVIQKLIIAFPLAIEHLDIDRRLYPLIWSRLARPSAISGCNSIDALFLSIQGNPSCFGR